MEDTGSLYKDLIDVVFCELVSTDLLLRDVKTTKKFDQKSIFLLPIPSFFFRVRPGLRRDVLVSIFNSGTL